MRALHGNLIIERPDASPTDSATSTTTDYASCSSPTEPGPVDTARTMLRTEEPVVSSTSPAADCCADRSLGASVS
ncbi:MAG: hypothetical protein QOG01_976 [Pseudonocardiales bacterium]|nr:hypothetical protein [Pseudonocardiales bacterium]